MKPLFVGTGYLRALELACDQNPAAARRHWRALLDALPPLVATGYVFDETVTFCNGRGYHAEAVEVGNNPLRSLSESIGTTTSGGRLVFHVFGALGQFERDLVGGRTRAGLAAARLKIGKTALYAALRAAGEAGA